MRFVDEVPVLYCLSFRCWCDYNWLGWLVGSKSNEIFHTGTLCRCMSVYQISHLVLSAGTSHLYDVILKGLSGKRLNNSRPYSSVYIVGMAPHQNVVLTLIGI